MSGPTGRKRAHGLALPAGTAVLPTAERVARGPVAVEDTLVDGSLRRVVRGLDTLAVLHRHGAIDDAALSAGRWFQRRFNLAGLETLSAGDMARVAPGAGNGVPDAALDARADVAAAIIALGGFAAPCGQAMWHVVGFDMSIAQWAERVRHGQGRMLNERVATGIVIGALGVLASHYGGRHEARES